MDTLGSLAAEVVDYLAGEMVPAGRIATAINDGIESLWESLILAALQIYMKGPVSVDIAAAQEGVILATVLDPTAVLTLTAVPATGLAAHSVGVRYTLVTESGSETLASPPVTLAVLVNEAVSVASPIAVSGAFGWNCYAITTLGPITGYARQNEEPIPFGSSFTESGTGFISGSHLPAVPVENTTGDNIFYIRRLEFQTSSGAYQSYNAGDLDSSFMRRMSQGIASSSEYQSYAWDLINQRQLEIRPAAGRSFTPRYFYIVKPRRLAYTSAPLPFPHVPQKEYLRAEALSAIFLTLHEFDAAQAWDIKATKALAKAVRALTALNRNRDTRVVPYMY